MDPKIKERKSNAGRPPKGIETCTAQLKVRLDPYLASRISRTAKALGISRAELLRQSVLLYLNQLEKTYPELKRT